MHVFPEGKIDNHFCICRPRNRDRWHRLTVQMKRAYYVMSFHCVITEQFLSVNCTEHWRSNRSLSCDHLLVREVNICIVTLLWTHTGLLTSRRWGRLAAGWATLRRAFPDASACSGRRSCVRNHARLAAASRPVVGHRTSGAPPRPAVRLSGSGVVWCRRQRHAVLRWAVNSN